MIKIQKGNEIVELDGVYQDKFKSLWVDEEMCEKEPFCFFVKPFFESSIIPQIRKGQIYRYMIKVKLIDNWKIIKTKTLQEGLDKIK